MIPLLQSYLKIGDPKAAEDLYAFHVPVFQRVPWPLFPGMHTARTACCEIPPAASLKESEIADPSSSMSLSETDS